MKNNVRACSPLFSFTTSGLVSRCDVAPSPPPFFSFFFLVGDRPCCCTRAPPNRITARGKRNFRINYVGTRKIAISRMLGRSLLLRPSPSRPYTTPSQPVPFHPRGIAFARVVSRRYFGIGWWWVARCFNHRFHDDPGTPSDSRGPAPGFNTSRPVHGSPRCYLSGPTTVIFFPHARRRFAARKRSFETAKSPPAGCSNQRPTISFFLSPSPSPFAFRVASRRIDPRITKKRVYNLCMELLIDSPHRFNDRFTRYKEFLSRSSPRFLAVY